MKKTNWLLIGILVLLPVHSLCGGRGQSTAEATAYVQSVLDQKPVQVPPAVVEQAHASVASQAHPPVLQRRNARYKIERGDVLALDFPFTPEFNDSVTVQPDGYISLRGIGDTLAAGKTVPELDASLRKVYAKILHDPVITVSLTDFEKPYFIALGEVSKPGKYDLHGDMTVTQALAIAGGYTDEAKHSEILLFRRVSDNWAEVKTLNVKRMFDQKDLAEDIYLQPGDLLFVPKNFVSKAKPYLPINLFRINLTSQY